MTNRDHNNILLTVFGKTVNEKMSKEIKKKKKELSGTSILDRNLRGTSPDSDGPGHRESPAISDGLGHENSGPLAGLK